MNEYDQMLSDIVNRILQSNNETINLSPKLRNTLDISLYSLLFNINQKEYKYEISGEENNTINDFIRLLNNYKVQIELKRNKSYLEDIYNRLLDSYYNNENILINYISDSIRLEDIINNGIISELDHLIIEISKNKKEKENIINNKDKKLEEYIKLIKDKNYDFDIVEFKDVFSYLLNIDNYEFNYQNSKIRSSQLSIVNDIIDIINNKDINIDKISKIIIPLLLNRIDNINYNDKLIDSSAFKIENISINDLLHNKNNEIKDNVAKVKYGGNDIALSNNYLLDKVLSIFKRGKYYFNEDMFIIDDKDFKSSIVINKMIDYLINII